MSLSAEFGLRLRNPQTPLRSVVQAGFDLPVSETDLRGSIRRELREPHLEAATSKAQFLVAVAARYDARSPNDKTALRETFAKAANLPIEIEVCANTAHGWCPPDSRMYTSSRPRKLCVACWTFTRRPWYDQRDCGSEPKSFLQEVTVEDVEELRSVWI